MELSEILSQIDAGTYTPPTSTTASSEPPIETPTTTASPASDPTPSVTPLETPSVGAPQTPNEPEKAPATPPEQTETPEQIFTGSKQNQAFAQLRTQNKQYLNIISRLGQTLGVEDTSNPDKIAQEVEKRLQAYEASQSNVPLPVLQQLEATKQLQLQQEQELNRTKALQGFQRVKDTYNLDDAQLKEFAVQLNDLGKNPFVESLDLLTEYKMLNYDALIAKAQKEAIAEERARAAKAAQHSSAPSPTSGAAPAQTTSVKTTTDVVNFLKSQNAY